MKWFKKRKKTSEPSWKISTKIPPIQSETLIRSRVNKVSSFEYARVVTQFFWRYFRTVGWIFLWGILITSFIVLFTTPFFSLKSEKIELVLDPEPVFDRSAIMTLLRDFSGKNIFRLTATEIFTSLQENIRHIQSVEKTLLLPDGIRIKVVSSGPIYRAFIGDEVFLLTKNGQLIADIPEIDISSLRIHNLIPDLSGTQNTTLPTTDTLIIQEIEKLWYHELPNFPIEAIDYYDQEKELHITSQGTRFIFTLFGWSEQLRLTRQMKQIDIVKQLQMITLLINQEKIFPKRYLTIDIRVPKKLYVCPRDNVDCKNNLIRIYGI